MYSTHFHTHKSSVEKTAFRWLLKLFLSNQDMTLEIVAVRENVSLDILKGHLCNVKDRKSFEMELVQCN